MRGSPPTSHENYQAFSSPLMWEDRGGGGHGVSPLTPALSHQGRGGTSSYFLRNSNGQNSTPPHPSPLPPGERDRVRGGVFKIGVWILFGIWPACAKPLRRRQVFLLCCLRPLSARNAPPQPPLSPAGERDRVRGTTLTTLNLHRAIRTKKVHGHSIAP